MTYYCKQKYKCWVDEMTVDETGVDETVVDETGVDELGINPVLYALQIFLAYVQNTDHKSSK